MNLSGSRAVKNISLTKNRQRQTLYPYRGEIFAQVVTKGAFRKNGKRAEIIWIIDKGLPAKGVMHISYDRVLSGALSGNGRCNWGLFHHSANQRAEGFYRPLFALAPSPGGIKPKERSPVICRGEHFAWGDADMVFQRFCAQHTGIQTRR